MLAYAGGGEWRPLRARYLIHSETATYPEAPTKADSVLTVVIDGQAAKELFDLVGPDSHPTCSSENGDRDRRKKGVECSYTAKLSDPKESHYRCWIGLNLRTGEGDVRVSC
ncbi:hypothetical protein GM676_18045 [Duganella radicis]|uniref:Uncharacterized protein n=1 Tax=Duganella radicis TaxID=551988 RepID=A0A6L6PLG5_9BURK|nr:hypothetical protein [Duganella radicis]